MGAVQPVALVKPEALGASPKEENPVSEACAASDAASAAAPGAVDVVLDVAPCWEALEVPAAAAAAAAGASPSLNPSPEPAPSKEGRPPGPNPLPISLGSGLP